MAEWYLAMSARRRKTVQIPKPAGAPAYMSQFTSLMTILLAFFIVMLSLGQEKNAGFKVGVGMIRNLVGLVGGAGVLEFWRYVRRPSAPAVSRESRDIAEALVGFERASGDQSSLSRREIDRVDFENMRQTLRLRSSIRFEPNRLRLRRDTQYALDQAAALLYTLNEYSITVGVHVDTGDMAADRYMAARRAAWLTRHLVENARVPSERIRSLGLARRFDNVKTGEPTEVVFLLRRVAKGRGGDWSAGAREGANHEGVDRGGN